MTESCFGTWYFEKSSARLAVRRGVLTIGLMLCLAAVSIGASELRGPEKAIGGDPAGDAVGEGQPLDVTRFAAVREGEDLKLRLELTSDVSPADSGRADALFGFVDLDTDQSSVTGETAVADYVRASATGLGSDAVVDLSTYRQTDGSVDLVASSGSIERVPASFGERSVDVTIPVDLVGGDGAVSAAAVTGNELALTDVVPDSGFLATTDAGTEGVVLRNGRFLVDVSWRNGSGGTGAGSLVFQSDDSAVFWFFNSANWELMVKVIDGCPINDRFWVFSAATTDVEFTIQVTDTASGAVKTYRNPLGTSAPAVTDTGAFAACGAGS